MRRRAALAAVGAGANARAGRGGSGEYPEVVVEHGRWRWGRDAGGREGGGRERGGWVRGRLLVRGCSLAPGTPPIGRHSRCGHRGVDCRGAGGGSSGVAASSRARRWRAPRMVAGGIV